MTKHDVERPGATPPSRIPEFASYEEEAEFWDTHDFTDFQDEFRPVRARFAKNLSGSLDVPLSPQALAQLDAKAAGQGVSSALLARQWILERLAEVGQPDSTETKRSELVAAGSMRDSSIEHD
jgi:hypothetical protein